VGVSAAPYLEVRDVTVSYRRRGWRAGRTLAVQDVSLSVARGQVLGLIGESGSGKTTLGRVILGLARADRGHVTLDGEALDLDRGRPSPALGLRVQAIFQDSAGTLDPRQPVRAAIEEALARRGLGRASRPAEVKRYLEMVGLAEPLADRLPRELSGGQRQRIGIARALAMEPEFLICDEPTASLDVSVQAQVLNLLQSLRKELGLTYVFVGHNLAVVAHMSDVVAVMYRGRVVEVGAAESVCFAPLHPYTRSLVAASLAPDSDEEMLAGRELIRAPSGTSASGCDYLDRCALARSLSFPTACSERKPVPVELANGHRVACHFAVDQGE
jgi:peptide/nickel transport system ATP-binding protein